MVVKLREGGRNEKGKKGEKERKEEEEGMYKIIKNVPLITSFLQLDLLKFSVSPKQHHQLGLKSSTHEASE